MWLDKITAFVNRDFRIWKSYGVFPVLNILAVFFHVFVFFYIAQTFNAVPVRFKEYSGNYIPFFFVGIVINGFLLSFLNSFSFKIRREQLLGVFESLVAAPINDFLMIGGLVAWDLLYGFLRLVLYFMAGTFCFGFYLGPEQAVAFMVVLLLGTVCFFAFGIISAAYIIYFKRNDPFGIILSVAAGFLSGVYVPVREFPLFLQKIAQCIPLTYILRDLRLVLLKGYTLSLLKQDIFILIVFIIIILPFSSAVFSAVMRKVKRDGSLAHY
jgi:ABC-2 type transport system permease protein